MVLDAQLQPRKISLLLAQRDKGGGDTHAGDENEPDTETGENSLNTNDLFEAAQLGYEENAVE